MNLIQSFKNRNLGFTINEVMSGEHWFEPGFGPEGKRFMEFRGTWGPKSFKEWLSKKNGKFMWQEMKGSVTVDGLCRNAPMKGSLKLDYFGENKIRYDFEFKAKGKDYHFVGEKVNIKPWNLPISHTTCYGRLTEKRTGKLVSTSVTHWRFSTLPQFIGSLRFKFSD